MPTGVGPNEYILDEDGKDLKSTAKKTLADYLSARTIGGAESFTPPTQGGGTYTYMPPRPSAYPVQATDLTEIPADASRTSAGQYAADLTAHVGNPNMRNVVKLEPATERQNNGGESGHVVLNSTPLVKPAVSSILSKNRFASGENKFTAKSYDDAMPRSPVLIGQDGGINFTRNAYEAMRLASIASMLNAAGGSSGPGQAGTFTISDIAGGAPAASDVANVLNSTQLGLEKIESVNTRVAPDRQRIPAPTRDLEFDGTDTDSQAASDLETAFGSTDISSADEARYTKKSFGQLNTYLEQFSGAGTGNMILLALAAYAALFIATAVVSFILAVIIGRLPRPDYRSATLPLGAERGPSFGSFFFDPPTDSSILDALGNIAHLISKILGVMQPYEGGYATFPYFRAALEGALSIIGVDVDQIGDNPVTILSDALPSIIINFGLTPSYYVTIVREISRDLALLVSGESGGSGIFGIFESLRSLKILRFVDTCARLGIVNMKAKDSDRSVDPDLAAATPPQGGDTTSPQGLLTNVYDTAQKRVSRSRETAGSKRLAWSHSALGYTRSELITKDLLRSLSVQKIGTSETGIDALRNLRSRKVTGPDGVGRISAEQREYHEQLLDAEYMPFYFHDLRTNEILSFHAFLSSLSDSFTANYSSVDGFGRMDPVQIYKNTTRAISFTFTVVSTSPDDHEQMWYSVNKLVNMVYPQWSEGDTLTTADSVYTQPFSQTIAASPMLRVRIGDVIHSNYSRFALGRIFGLDKSGAKLKGVSLDKDDGDGGSIPDVGKMFNETAANQAGADFVSGEVVVGAVTSKLSDTPSNDLNALLATNTSNDVISVAAATLAAKINPPKVEIKSAKGNTFDFYDSEVSALIKDNSYKSKFETSDPTGVIVAYTTTEKTADKDPAAYAVVLLDVPISISGKGGSLLTYTHAVVPQSKVRIVGSLPANTSIILSNSPPDSTVATSVSDFLNPANNSIVRSFEVGSGGRGLAGFITQLGMEYGGTDITWNVERGSRAPNTVTISVSFTPIHDIPMGLASDGTSRSVAYPVGDITRKRFSPDLAQKDYEARTVLNALQPAAIKGPTKPGK
jgi:hypothetical protein